jgi:hypothetical protein
MSFQHKKYDIEMQTLQTLSQKLAARMPQLCDYACNAYADKLAMIDLYLTLFSEDAEFCEKLEVIRLQFKTMGEALYIKKADVLTNLGLKVGRTGQREMSGRRHADPTT